MLERTSVDHPLGSLNEDYQTMECITVIIEASSHDESILDLVVAK